MLCRTVGNTAARHECLSATQQIRCSSPGTCGLCRLRCAAARACCSLLQLLRCLKRAWRGKSYHGGCPEVNMSVDDRRVNHCTQVQAALRQNDPSLTACCLGVSCVLDCAVPLCQCYHLLERGPGKPHDIKSATPSHVLRQSIMQSFPWRGARGDECTQCHKHHCVALSCRHQARLAVSCRICRCQADRVFDASHLARQQCQCRSSLLGLARSDGTWLLP
jgi:hypothetical protein